MKAVKRATCPTCTYDTTTPDGKTDKAGFSATMKCPKDGSKLKLSAQWYARGMHEGKKIMKPCGVKKGDAEAFIASCVLAIRSGTAIPGMEPDIPWAEAVENCEGWWDKAVERKEMKPDSRNYYRDQVKVLDKGFFGTT